MEKTKKNFRVAVAIYSFLGLVYVSAIVFNTISHDMNAALGFFCAVCNLVIAFIWYCDNMQMRKRLPKNKNRSYLIILQALTDNGNAYGNVYVTTTLFNRDTLIWAKKAFEKNEADLGITLTQEPLILGTVLLDSKD